MKFSTRSRYGIRAIVDLAINSKENNCISLKSIAKRQDIPENYLEQLMRALKKADIVKSIRGAQGGYVLNKNPEEISVGDLIFALEGNLNLVDCVDSIEPKNKCRDADCNSCKVKSVWITINQKLSETANLISLKDLIN